MTQKTATFQKNLEEAIVEYKKMACPNPECDDVIVSREKVISSQRSVVEYWCRNPKCAYHAKRKVYRRSTHTQPGPAPSQNESNRLENSAYKDFTNMAVGIVMISVLLGYVGYLLIG
ncbi:MAG: hypothetical protein AAF990_00415 [Bacteroidota bacterium]